MIIITINQTNTQTYRKQEANLDPCPKAQIKHSQYMQISIKSAWRDQNLTRRFEIAMIRSV